MFIDIQTNKLIPVVGAFSMIVKSLGTLVVSSSVPSVTVL